MDEETKATLSVISEQNLIAQVDTRQKACEILRQLRDEGRGLKEIIRIVHDLYALTSSLF